MSPKVSFSVKGRSDAGSYRFFFTVALYLDDTRISEKSFYADTRSSARRKIGTTKRDLLFLARENGHLPK